MVRATAGAELCATHANSNPNPSDCIRAYDETYKGRVDLATTVRVGEPVQQSKLHWVVPYDVSDAAGNAADRVWRDVIVEEVDLANMESKLRLEAMSDKENEIQVAVSKALEDSERRKSAEIQAEVQKAVDAERKKRGGRDRRGGTSCPECPRCDCRGKFDESMCEAICAAQPDTGTCSLHEDSYVVSIMLWLEDFLPLQAIPIVVFTILVVFVLTSVRWFVNLVLWPATQPRMYIASDERERALQSSVTVIHSNSKPMNGPGLPPTTPTASDQLRTVHPSIFSPQAGSFGSPPAYLSPTQQSGGRSSVAAPGSGYEDIYASPDVITPSRRGEGHFRASPYSQR